MFAITGQSITVMSITNILIWGHFYQKKSSFSPTATNQCVLLLLEGNISMQVEIRWEAGVFCSFWFGFCFVLFCFCPPMMQPEAPLTKVKSWRKYLCHQWSDIIQKVLRCKSTRVTTYLELLIATFKRGEQWQFGGPEALSIQCLKLDIWF